MTDAQALAKALEKALDASGDTAPYVFSEDEVTTLLKVVAFVEKLAALKWFGQILLWCAVTVGTVILNWERIKGFFQ